MAQLQEVFGISARIDGPSYVDRGGLDERFSRALSSSRHVAVHGGSKQGKSWLRTKGLPVEESVLVQCTPTSTAASLLSEALGRLGVDATISVTKTREIGGTLDFSGSVEIGKLLAKGRVDGSLGGTASGGSSAQLAPIGQTPADLLWVSSAIVASRKQLVFEDFHYLPEEEQHDLAFMFKAMGEYGLFVVFVGVWPQDHLLTYFNGDLEGRIEDIRLSWSDKELHRVLEQGCEALNIRFDAVLLGELVREASGSVGLLQRLAEQLCIEENVLSTFVGGVRPRKIAAGSSFVAARAAVAAQMQGRYQTFADNFVRGMRRLPEGLEVYRHLLEAATHASDQELSEGLDSAQLLIRIAAQPGGEGIRPSDLTQALERIDKLQVKIKVNPLVLTYSRPSRKLYLADPSFLFFRRHGQPKWPWAAGEPVIENDLYVSEPLDMDFDFGTPLADAHEERQRHRANRA